MATNPIHLDALLLRARAPDLVLRPGMVLAARVAERSGRHGVLTLAGAALVAELPDEVAAGDRLRLTVVETGPERVVMRLTEPPSPPAHPAVQLPLPDGRAAGLRVEERAGGQSAEEEADAVAVTYDSPRLGAIEFRLALSGDALSAAVRAGAGAPYAMAEERLEALREALAAATGRAASVSLTARRDPFDVYA